MNTLHNIKAPLALITFIFAALLLAESSQASSTQHEGYSDLMVRSTYADDFAGDKTEWLVTSTVAPNPVPEFPYGDMVTRLRFVFKDGYDMVGVGVWANTGHFSGKLNCYGGGCSETADIQVKIGDADPIYASISIAENNESFRFRSTRQYKSGLFGGKFVDSYPIREALMASQDSELTVRMRVPFSIGETVDLSYVVDVDAYKRFHAEYEAANADYKAKR